MKNYVSIVILFFSGLLFSCSEETVISGATYCKTFITGYLTPETISVENANSEIKLTFKGKIITSGKTFDELSKYYNDLTYNRYVVNGPRIAVNDSVCKMTIKTVDDFDASHLAGSDISDLVECQYVSYYDYIHNDYKIVNTKALQTQGLNGYSYIEGAEIKNMNLAEICYDNTKLIAPEFMLKFKKTPEKKGEYHFDLTVILNGEKLTKTIDFVFKEERSDPQSIHFRPIYQPFPVFIQFDSKPYHFSFVCLERFQVLVCDNLPNLRGRLR